MKTPPLPSVRKLRTAGSESGKTLVLALVILGLATVLVGTFILYVSTSLRVTQVAEEQITSHYSADSGIEHAIWQLKNDADFVQAVKELSSDSGVYTYTLELNGQTVVISVTTTSGP